MPLLMVPYTMGSQLGVAGVAPLGGKGYYLRRKRYMAWIFASSLVLFLC